VRTENLDPDVVVIEVVGPGQYVRTLTVLACDTLTVQANGDVSDNDGDDELVEAGPLNWWAMSIEWSWTIGQAVTAAHAMESKTAAALRLTAFSHFIRLMPMLDYSAISGRAWRDPRRNGLFLIDDGFRGSGRLDGGAYRDRTCDPST
jgi:hypothetical protein